ncbi:uncharacterized protein LOC134841793 [Symsagittifera roscoffensis]|uniref:uncharacterized protein LOC134841793 n=1 Tax=Symsagittifera roscoffensis TaxID=84072 RepID=UPI00307B7D22
MREFHKELENFELDLPGREKVSFNNNARLLEIMRSQYPNWEEAGKVTSIPIARIPRLFLKNVYMSKDQQKEFHPLQKGEEGEIKIYQLLLESLDKNRKGVLVLSKVNGREMFATTSAQVEIDTVLIHPAKGVFLFNIKAQGGKGLTPQKVEKDFKKHSNFLRMLMQYGYENETDFPPIHSVYCHLVDDNKEKFEGISKQLGGALLICTKSDLKPETFCSSWSQKLDGVPDFDHKLTEIFEVFIARLAALNSIEGSLALIHDQISTNYAQATNKNKNQFGTTDEDTKAVLNEASRTSINSKKRDRYIIWKPEQVQIISTVVEHLQDPSREGLRLLVRGCKGSGKTMLLIFLAKIAVKIIESQHPGQNNHGKVVVYNGDSLTRKYVSEKLEHLLEPSGVIVDAAGKYV